MSLAHMLFPEETQLRMADRIVSESLGPAFRREKNLADLESEYPGIIDAILTELRPLLRGYVKKGLPEYYERVATLYASRLTAAEIDDLAAFYRSPTGQKLTRTMAESYRMDAVLREVVDDPVAPTSLEAVSRDHQTATASVIDAVEETDRDALIALAKKPYVAKVRALGTELRKLEQEMMNEPEPEFEAAVDRVVSAALDSFIAAADAKRGR